MDESEAQYATFFYTNIWLPSARRNGFLSIIGTPPLFSVTDDFSPEPSVSLPSAFLFRPPSYIHARDYIRPRNQSPITNSVILFFFGFDWHPASMLPAVFPPKSPTPHKQDQELLPFVCILSACVLPARDD